MRFKPTTKNFLIWISLPVLLGALAALLFWSAFPVGGDLPKPDAGKLWTYISQTNNYQNWDQWPGRDGMYRGESPHGAFLKLYVNNLAEDAIENGNGTMPDKSILVKENYSEDKQLLSVTPMYRVKDFNPEAGDWFWAKYTPDGKVLAAGKVESCIACHSKRIETDYLYSPGE